MIDISNVFRLGTNHTLTVTDASGATATSAFGAQTQTVMVTTTAACFVAFDPDRPATTSSTYIAAGTPYLFCIKGGSRCSAITGSGTATCYITEMTR